tara:strand:+ start:729 stop:1322 length:594 start_codon:yes stop_codon:yes gene_type:complete
MIPPLLEYVRSLGHAVFTEGDYNLNIIGVRAASRDSDEFDDMMACIYKRQGRWMANYWPITTDPGRKLLEKPINKKGAAILKPGQYRGAYRIDNHKGEYPALCQRGPVTVYRDDNKDNILDMNEDNIQEGLFGINIHKRRSKGEKIRASSAGCQVFKHEEDFSDLMRLAFVQQGVKGWDTFTYTLVDAPEFFKTNEG